MCLPEWFQFVWLWWLKRNELEAYAFQILIVAPNLHVVVWIFLFNSRVKLHVNVVILVCIKRIAKEYLIGKCFRFLLVNVFWITDIYKCICNCVTIIIVSWFFIIFFYFYKFQSSPPNKLVIALMSEVSCIWYVEMFKNVKEQRMSHR